MKKLICAAVLVVGATVMGQGLADDAAVACKKYGDGVPIRIQIFSSNKYCSELVPNGNKIDKACSAGTAASGMTATCNTNYFSSGAQQSNSSTAQTNLQCTVSPPSPSAPVSTRFKYTLCGDDATNPTKLWWATLLVPDQELGNTIDQSKP